MRIFLTNLQSPQQQPDANITNEEESLVEGGMDFLSPDMGKARKVLTGMPQSLTGKAQLVLTGEHVGVEQRRPSSTLSIHYLEDDAPDFSALNQ